MVSGNALSIHRATWLLRAFDIAPLGRIYADSVALIHKRRNGDRDPVFKSVGSVRVTTSSNDGGKSIPIGDPS
jgi:hypothetical protein